MNREHLAEIYTALHEGKEPDEFLTETWRPYQGVRLLGPNARATEIQYKKKIPDDFPSYHHPWADQAQPSIGIDSRRQVVIFAGKYETTRRGIEDRVLPGMETVEYLKQPYVQKERVPGRPRMLITLGTLEWIGYKEFVNGGWVTKKLVFNPSIAPEIAHDQNGDLHVLHGRYVISETGVEDSMKRSHRHRRSHHRYSNPASIAARHGGETGAKRAGRMILNSVIVGGVATLTAVGLNMGLAKLAPTWTLAGGGTATQQTYGALSKIGLGLGLGLGSAYVLPNQPQVAAGISVGGVVDGFLDLWNIYVAPRIASMSAPSSTTTTTTTTTAPAGLPMGGWGGLPRQYQGVSPAACGVGGR